MLSKLSYSFTDEAKAHEIHAYEVYAHEVHAREVHARGVHARGVHAHEVHAPRGIQDIGMEALRNRMLEMTVSGIQSV